MHIETIIKNSPLYIVAISCGQNYNGFPYARLLISDNPKAKASIFEEEIPFHDVVKKTNDLEGAIYTREINYENVPPKKTTIPLQEALYVGNGDLITIHHAPVGIETKFNYVKTIWSTHIVVFTGEDRSSKIRQAMYELFNHPKAVYYRGEDFLKDYRKFIIKIDLR